MSLCLFMYVRRISVYLYIYIYTVDLYVSLSVTSPRRASNQNPPNPQLQFKILGPNLSQGSETVPVGWGGLRVGNAFQVLKSYRIDAV